MNDKWLDDIQKRMSAYRYTEPKGLWEGLEAQLGPHRLHAWAWLGGAAALALAALTSIFVINRNSYKPINSSFTSPVLADATVSAGIEEKSFVVLPVNMSRRDTAENEVISNQEDPISEPEKPKEKPIEEERDDRPSLEEYLASVDEAEEHSAAKDNKLSFNIFAAGVSGADRTSRTMTAGPVNSVGMESSSWKDSPLLGIMMMNQGRETQTKTRYNLPVRFGLAFSYGLSDRIQISSGVSYTLLTSNSVEGSNNNYIENSSSLHYFGIPLTLSYGLYSHGNFNIYLAGGGLAEKCIAGKSGQKFVLNDISGQTTYSNIDMKPWQFSVNLSAGIRYDLSRHFSIYLEPGLAYYFKDGTELSTVYKEKPLNFDLRLGLRLNL